MLGRVSLASTAPSPRCLCLSRELQPFSKDTRCRDQTVGEGQWMNRGGWLQGQRTDALRAVRAARRQDGRCGEAAWGPDDLFDGL